MIVVDAMNVRGCVPDGWWRDKDDALGRLIAAVAAHDFAGEWVVIVADGRPVEGAPAGTHGDVELRYAGHTAPNAADDLIVEIVTADDDVGAITVVTSDRGLIDRLPDGTRIEGAKSFRNRVEW